MGKNPFALIVIACMLIAPAAWACKPLLPQDQIHNFVAAQPHDGIIFTGKVISVKEQRRADGDVVTETTLQPAQWWMGFREGPVVIRTISSSRSPCPDLGVLHARPGEQWLIAGWNRYSLIESSVELGAGMRLENGRLPRDIEQALRRAKAAVGSARTQAHS